jgi:Protein of unknown function (DUF2892)
VTQVTDRRQRGTHTARHRHFRRSSKQEKFMKSNVGGIDRILRAALGLVLVALAATGTIGLWGYVGVVLLGTAAFSFCPLYPLLGINTCPMKKG